MENPKPQFDGQKSLPSTKKVVDSPIGEQIVYDFVPLSPSNQHSPNPDSNTWTHEYPTENPEQIAYRKSQIDKLKDIFPRRSA